MVCTITPFVLDYRKIFVDSYVAKILKDYDMAPMHIAHTHTHTSFRNRSFFGTGPCVIYLVIIFMIRCELYTF